MPDLYLTIDKQSDSILEAIAESLDKRATEPAFRSICRSYMEKLPGPGADVLEIGCGNGASTELILEYIRPGKLVSSDPSEGLLARARKRLAHREDVSFLLGDAEATGAESSAFDVVAAHTVYSHLADPQAALAEAHRVLRPGGVLAIFDGDYATNTVALFDGDPLQAAMEATQRNLIHDPYVMRRLPRIAASAGFSVRQTMAHGYVQTQQPDYLMSLVDRGVDAAANAGECGEGLAGGFKNEIRRRVENGSFYGAILFVTLILEKTS